MVVDIITIFFSAEEKGDHIEKNHKKIVLAYLKGFFLLDCLACLPGIIIVENIEGKYENRRWVYYFKVIRYLQINRLFEEFHFAV